MGEVSAGSNSAHGVSGSPSGLYLFQGFSYPKESREASLNWRHILVLRRAASVILAQALRSAVFNDSARSGGKASNAVTSIRPLSVLGSSGPDGSDPLDSRDSSGSGVVAGLSSLGARYFARSGVPSAQLVVQRLGRGLGGSSRRRGNFRPLVSRRTGSFHQRQRALRCRKSSSLLCSTNFELHGGRVRGQFYGDCLPSQPRGHSVSGAQLHFSAHPVVGGVSSSSIGSAIHHGSQQRHSGLSIQTQSDLGVGVDPESRGFSRSTEKVARFYRPVRNLTKHQCCPFFFFSPFHDPNALGTDTLLQN